MNKRFWLAFAAVYVVFHIFGFVLHGMLLQGTYQSLAAVFRPRPRWKA